MQNDNPQTTPEKLRECAEWMKSGRMIDCHELLERAAKELETCQKKQ